MECDRMVVLPFIVGGFVIFVFVVKKFIISFNY